MATATISQPVLPAKPAADCNTYIAGLLDDLRKQIDGIPVIPGGSVSIDHATVMELRGAFAQTSVAVRNLLKWRA